MTEEQQEYRIEGRPSTIFRTVKSKDNPFVMIDRRPIDNKALSFKAKGILTYLMSRPDGWEVSVKDLFNHATDGEDAIRSGLAELRKAGHMKYVQERVKGRITGMVIEVYEVPLTSPHADFPDVEKPHVEKPDVENPTQVVSTLSSTESSSKERETRSFSQRDFYSMTTKDAGQVPELQRFRDATGTWPGVGQWWLIYQRMHADGLTVEQVRCVFEQWCALGFKPNNIDFLLYAKMGYIPNQKKVTHGKPNPNSKSEPAAPTTYADADRAAAERVKARKLAAAQAAAPM